MQNDEQLTFGKVLCFLIKKAKMTQAQFYKKIGITKSYFYDIASGKTNPPPAELQIKMLALLNPSREDEILFLDLAGKERKETPADIAWYLDSHVDQRNMLREEINYSVFVRGERDNG